MSHPRKLSVANPAILPSLSCIFTSCMFKFLIGRQLKKSHIILWIKCLNTSNLNPHIETLYSQVFAIMQIIKKTSINLFEHILPYFLCHIWFKNSVKPNSKFHVIGFFLVIKCLNISTTSQISCRIFINDYTIYMFSWYAEQSVFKPFANKPLYIINYSNQCYQHC